MARLSSIPYYDDKLQLIAKFKKDKTHLNSLQNGEVYMNRIGTYKKIEEDEGKKGVGDRYDGHTVISNLHNITLTNIETGETIQMESAKALTYSFDDILAMPVFCSFAIDSSMLEIIGENEDNYFVELVFEPQELEKIIKDFGENVLIIKYGHFSKLLTKTITEKGYALIGKRVKYADYSVNQSERIKDDEITNIAFWKSDEFSHQNEHRFVIPMLDIETPLTINIGDLSEHSRLLPTRDLIINPLRFPVQKPPESIS